jgi:hypothetical protein
MVKGGCFKKRNGCRLVKGWVGQVWLLAWLMNMSTDYFYGTYAGSYAPLFSFDKMTTLPLRPVHTYMYVHMYIATELVNALT